MVVYAETHPKSGDGDDVDKAKLIIDEIVDAMDDSDDIKDAIEDALHDKEIHFRFLNTWSSKAIPSISQILTHASCIVENDQVFLYIENCPAKLDWCYYEEEHCGPQNWGRDYPVINKIFII